MSTVALEQALSDLRSLPEPDQQLVLGFLQSLKRRTATAPEPRRSHSPALQLIEGALVFTGELEGTDTDWLRLVREEREKEIIDQAWGRPPAA